MRTTLGIDHARRARADKRGGGWQRVTLDEKLGLHLAFGRSEHFGGQVGPDRFSRPAAVIHQDHVYLPQLQPRIAVGCATLHMADGSRNVIMESGRYRIDFEAS